MQQKNAPGKRTKAEKEFLLKVGAMLASQITLQLVRDGIIIPDGKTDAQLKTEVASFIRTGLANKTIRLRPGIDHTQSLLAEARRSFRQEKFEFAALYFATFFEHKLNWLITQICHQKHIDELMVKQLLREASVRAKCTWILALLGHKPIRSDIQNAIGAINEIRNSFIHYKWPDSEEDHQRSTRLDAQMLGKLKKAETVIRYLRRFEEGKIYGGNGKRVRRIMKTVSPPRSGDTKSRQRAAAPTE